MKPSTTSLSSPGCRPFSLGDAVGSRVSAFLARPSATRDNSAMADNQTTPAAGEAGGDAAGVLRRASAATAAGARTAAPDVASGAARSWSFFQARVMPPRSKSLFGRLGDWLAVVGWGKFALVAILLMAFAGITSNVIYSDGPVVIVDRNGPADNVKVDIKVGPDGIRIERPNCTPATEAATASARAAGA